MSNYRIQEATNSDLKKVLEIERMAFGSEEEPKLVADLLIDESAQPALSLLAYDGNDAVGHILFTRCYITGNESSLSYILAPLAVKPNYQRKGIGGNLIKEGLRILHERGTEYVFVLGHFDYYPRFGFIPDAGSQGFPAPYPIAPEDANAWMFQPLREYGNPDISGKVQCAIALDKPEYWRE